MSADDRQGFRHWLPTLSYDRPVTVLMGFIALLVIGVIAWQRIPLQMLPDGFAPGQLWVQVPYPNASPTETDDKIVRPVEAQFGTIPGISTLRSRASSGSAGFGVEFHGGVDMDEAYNDVADRLDRAMGDLPDEVERTFIYRFDPQDIPIMWAGVQLPEAVDDPWHLMTRVVQPRLERIPGVAQIRVFGVPQRQVRIDFDKERTYAHGVDLGQVQRNLRGENFQMSSGKLLDRGLVRHARGLARLNDPAELGRFPVKDGVVLSDIADIRVGGAMSSDISRLNGEDAAGFVIRKEGSANTVEVARSVRAALAELESSGRAEGAKFFVFFDQGELVTEAIDTLTNTALTGGLFAVIVLFAFLREWKMTLLIAAAIPFSLLITVGVLYFEGHSLNLISLMGLMLAVGMVVDNAIVVVETIYRRRADGAGVRAAAIGGTAEVNLAILMSTATTMVVFLPVILMAEDANAALTLGELGLPVVFALAASLLVALIFAPLATRYMGRAAVKPDARWLVWLADRYQRALRLTLTRRSDALMTILAMVLLTQMVAVPGVSCGGGDDEDFNDFSINFRVPPQMGMSERDDVLKRLEDIVGDHQEEWEVRAWRSELDGNRNWGSIAVYLEPDATVAREDVMEKARALLPQDIPGVKASVGWEGLSEDGGGSGAQSIRLQIHGEDLATLSGLAEEVKRRVEPVEGVMSVTLDMVNDGADEVRLNVDRQATGRYGVSAMQIGQTVAFAMRSNQLQPIRDGEREIPVISSFSLEDRDTLDTLLDFEVWSPETMALVPLRTLTSTEVGKGPGTIRRENRRTGMGITVELEEGTPMMAAYERVGASLEDMVFPRGYSWSKGRDFDMQMGEYDSLLFAFFLSICFVFLLMGILFESWLMPLCIVATVPMAMFGAVWGLYLTGTPADTMVFVGFVVLVGVIVNNGIVLVDLVEQLRARGLERNEALIEAGNRRLRPILMTALTTICGLIPMAMGSSASIGVSYTPLGRTVIGGMTAGTLLTLLFVPLLYTLLDDLREASRAWLADLTGRTEIAPRPEEAK